MKKLNLVGKRFDRLLVVSEAPKTQGGRIAWNCLCNCGAKVVKSTKTLRKKDYEKSCGCSRAEKSRDRLWIDLTGQRFGRLVVLREAGSTPKGQSKWECICDCGNLSTVTGSNLRKRGTTSCGCKKAENNARAGDRTRTHGLSDSRIYHSWRAMIQRCENPSNPAYPYYGGRGIKVCDRWKVFEYFLEDMGHPPSSQHSIDRIDNDLGYSAKNCRWATDLEQGRNRRNVWKVEFGGEILTIAEWAERFKIKPTTLRYRIKHGWTVEKALTTPVKQ